jgi:hypothetical protein
VSPDVRRRGALVLLVLVVVGWPVSALTFARGEPPTTLALSWLAILLTAVDILSTSDVRAQQEGDT